MSIYEDPVIQKVIDLLEASGPSKLRGRYINGDVLLPNKSELPLCYITKDVTTAQPATNLEDENLFQLVATVILAYAARKAFSASSTQGRRATSSGAMPAAPQISSSSCRARSWATGSIPPSGWWRYQRSNRASRLTTS